MCILFVEGELVSEGKGWTFAFFLCVLMLCRGFLVVELFGNILYYLIVS